MAKKRLPEARFYLPAKRRPTAVEKRTKPAVEAGHPVREPLKNKAYLPELSRLQVELVKLQEWIRHEGLKVVVVFEGRDAAGKGGVIKTITASLSPRVCRVVALTAPTEREKTQWYFQRYVAHLPAAGEMVLFDRSWYNRAGVERVMGFCTEEEYREFLRSARSSSGCSCAPESSSSSTGSRSAMPSRSDDSRRGSTIRPSAGS